MKRLFLALALGGLLSVPAAASSSITGTLVNIASYVTGDSSATTFNMGAMMGSSGMYGAGMNGSGMHGTGMHGTGMNGAGGYGHGMYACRSAVGIVTAGGDLYLLAVDSPSFNVSNLCSRIGSRATVQGSVFRKGGMRVIRVESFTSGS